MAKFLKFFAPSRRNEHNKALIYSMTCDASLHGRHTLLIKFTSQPRLCTRGRMLNLLPAHNLCYSCMGPSATYQTTALDNLFQELCFSMTSASNTLWSLPIQWQDTGVRMSTILGRNLLPYLWKVQFFCLSLHCCGSF